MKFSFVLFLTFVSIFSYGKKEKPQRTGDIYSNPNGVKGRKFYMAPGLVVWDEGGRPYWGRAEEVKKETKKTVKAKTPIKTTSKKVVDSDRDGVSDIYDRCAKTPMGTKVNAFGCEFKKNLGVNLEVRFELGKSVLKRDYTKQVDLLADMMKKNKDLKVEIQGHTDNTGKRDLNFEISKRRSMAVRNYLISKGITPNRVISKGMGPDSPIADNSTIRGRKINRRVNAKIIQ